MTKQGKIIGHLFYIKLCASSQTPRWIQPGVTVRKCSIRVKISDFLSVWPWNLMDDLEQVKSEGFDSCDRPSNLTQIEIWWMTSKTIKAPLLYYIKLCASFQIHQWIQTQVTVRKPSIRVKIGDFLSCVTLKFDGRPWKTIERLFYNTLSFVQHFKASGIFDLVLKSGNAQFG